MEGKDIIESILSEARKKAEEIISAAEENKNRAVEQARSILESKQTEVLAATDVECSQIVDRRVMLAKLDASKVVLGQKQQLIEEVYSKAADSIIALDDQSYRKFVASLIKEYADDGDEVLVCQSDAARLNAEWIDSVSKDVNKKLSLSCENHFEKGGVILRGKSYDKKLTVNTLIEEVRVNTESQVINKLFG